MYASSADFLSQCSIEALTFLPALGDVKHSYHEITHNSGYHVTAMDGGTASGKNAIAVGEGAVAVGDGAIAYGEGSVAIGNGAIAVNGQRAIGNDATAGAIRLETDDSDTYGYTVDAEGYLLLKVVLPDGMSAEDFPADTALTALFEDKCGNIPLLHKDTLTVVEATEDTSWLLLKTETDRTYYNNEYEDGVFLRYTPSETPLKALMYPRVANGALTLGSGLVANMDAATKQYVDNAVGKRYISASEPENWGAGDEWLKEVV